MARQVVHAVVSAQDQRPALGGADRAAQLVHRGGAFRLAAGGGAARGAASALDGTAHDGGQPLRQAEHAALRHGGGAPAGGLRAPGAQRRRRRPRGLRTDEREGPRGGGGLLVQPRTHGLRRERQGIPCGHRRRQPGGRTRHPHLSAQRACRHRPAVVVGTAGGAPLRHGADTRRRHVANAIHWQRAP